MGSSMNQTADSRAGLFAGWQGIGLIAATYVYFLIFAQFGFLARLHELGFRDAALKPVLGLMAFGGILASLLATRLKLLDCPRCRLQGGQLGCAAAAFLARMNLDFTAACAVALLIGLALGLQTVTLVTYLPRWLGRRNPMLKIAIGTGLGYFLCNLPFLFSAPPRGIALVSALVALFALPLAFANISGHEQPQRPARALAFGWVLLFFTALIWFDSAAFYIIQNTQALKAGTWGGDLHLYQNAFIHLAAALAAAALLAWRGITGTLGTAFLFLAVACLLLAAPQSIHLAALLYPAGVSLYSVALVAYPSFLSQANGTAQRALQAGWLYAIAGWGGSAMGIGMAQNLHSVPWQFILSAAALVSFPLLRQLSRAAKLQVFCVLLVLLVAGVVARSAGSPARPVQATTAVERGHQIYTNEGCINCHSQYLRPSSYDNLLWGPASDLSAIRKEQPPLIGNRRQGPDLTNVGLRRSTQWLRIHFIDPRAVSHNSPMPSYSYLFKDGRGEDLIAYLDSIQSPGAAADRAQVRNNWIPVPSRQPAQTATHEGAVLFANLCATCHEAGGRARWYAGFKRIPPDLSSSPLMHLQLNQPEAQIRLELARIIKFGILGTDMAGHEYLTDEQINALDDYVFDEKILRRSH